MGWGLLRTNNVFLCCKILNWLKCVQS